MRESRMLWTFVVVFSLVIFVHSSSLPAPTPPPTPPPLELVRRQDKSATGNDNVAQPTTFTAGGGAKTTAKSTATGSKSDDSGSNNESSGSGSASGTDNQASITGTDSQASVTGTGTKTGTSTKTKAIPLNSPPGSIEMKTPSIMDSMQYYPIGGPAITFGWNMTNILVRPTALNVEAYCAVNQQYYTIAANYSAQETTVTWDTGKYQASATAPLLVETYTLFIYDSSKSRTAAPSPGRLFTFNNLRFGLYNPKSAIPLKDYHCDLCSAAAILLSHEVRVFLGTAFIFAVSMAWFIAGVAL